MTKFYSLSKHTTTYDDSFERVLKLDSLLFGHGIRGPASKDSAEDCDVTLAALKAEVLGPAEAKASKANNNLN